VRILFKRKEKQLQKIKHLLEVEKLSVHNKIIEGRNVKFIYFKLKNNEMDYCLFSYFCSKKKEWVLGTKKAIHFGTFCDICVQLGKIGEFYENKCKIGNHGTKYLWEQIKNHPKYRLKILF